MLLLVAKKNPAGKINTAGFLFMGNNNLRQLTMHQGILCSFWQYWQVKYL